MKDLVLEDRCDDFHQKWKKSFIATALTQLLINISHIKQCQYIKQGNPQAFLFLILRAELSLALLFKEQLKLM